MVGLGWGGGELRVSVCFHPRPILNSFELSWGKCLYNRNRFTSPCNTIYWPTA